VIIKEGVGLTCQRFAQGISRIRKKRKETNIVQEKAEVVQQEGRGGRSQRKQKKKKTTRKKFKWAGATVERGKPGRRSKLDISAFQREG